MMEGWPTAADYVAWARTQGFAVDITETQRADRSFIAIAIANPAGGTVIELVETIDEPLASTSIARLDRRLGVKSWLFE